MRIGRCQRGILLLVLLAAGTAPASAAGDVDHAGWEELTNRHVAEGRVDYAGMARDRGVLERYLTLLGAADPARLPSDKARLAFWINAYNACAVEEVLDHYPLASVKGVKGFFDRVRCHVAGREMTLNDIEGQARALQDWRVHVALARPCAGCPPLRSEAYAAQWLEPQLTEQVQEFLKDAARGFRATDGTLWVSPIFKRHAKDIVPGKLSADALLEVLRPYLAPAAYDAAHGHRLALKFLPEDWALNSAPQPGGR